MGRRRKYAIPEMVKDRTVCSPSVRLRDLLRLGNNPTLFRNLKQQLYRIAEKHLVLEYIITEQTKELSAVEAELVSTLPDIFDCEDSEALVKLACDIMKAYHYRRRCNSKQQLLSGALSPKKRSLVMSVTVPTRAALKKARDVVKNGKENDVIDFTLDDDNEKPKEKVEPKLPLMTDISNWLPGPATIKAAARSTSPLKLDSSHIARPSTLGSSVVHNISQSTPLHAESSSQALASNNANLMQGNHEDAFKLTGVTRVARFLNACSPSMAHFLRPFIDFGCTGDEYLVAVSTWPTDKISHFLRQVVSRRGDKGQFSQMDILILQNHFLSYFKAQT